MIIHLYGWDIIILYSPTMHTTLPMDYHASNPYNADCRAW